MLRKVIVMWAFFTPCILFAQTGKTDSLYTVLKTEKEDTNKVKLLNALSFALYATHPDTTIILAQQALVLSKKIGWKQGEALTYNRMGIGYQVKGNYTEALSDYLQSLSIYDQLGDKKGQANNLCNIGLIYYDKGDYLKGLGYYQDALVIFEKLDNKKGQAGVLGNIGAIYHEEGDYPKALDYELKALKEYEEIGFKPGQATYLGNIGLIYKEEADSAKALDYEQKALKIYEEIGDKQGQARNLGNIGSIYNGQGNKAKAFKYEWSALKMNEELGNKEGMANNLNNLGSIYNDQGEYPKALDYYKKALTIFQELGNKRGEAGILGNIGALFLKTGKFSEAEANLQKAIILDSAIKERNELRESEVNMARLFDTTQRYKLAVYWLKKSAILKDTLFNIEKNKALTRKELTYQFERKGDSIQAQQDKKDALAASENKKQKIITYSIAGGMLLSLLFAFFIFRSLRTTRKQKEVIEVKNKETEEQKKVIEEKNKDIIDSITYAKRLQDAILPPLSVIKKHLPESFVLYKPKDIVAGDFYWMERMGDSILIAACDSTGHGVPGAMVSVVCSNALNRTVKEFKIIEPGKILDKVRELVLETFEKSEGEVKDGMDASLCSLNINTGEIKWSGANNPLCYMQNGELKELAPDKQPIGVFENIKCFNTVNLKLNKGDSLYLFTDGYADQFGGPKGKKFKYKQMQELFFTNAHKPMEEQGHILNETIDIWKGKLEQVDDILVIGIRI